MNQCLWENEWALQNRNQSNLNDQSENEKIFGELKEETSKPPKARESAGGQVMTGLSFSSDWLR